MRKKIVAGNWKMNMTPKEAVGLISELRDKVSGSNVDVVFCVPAIDIIPVVEAVKGTDIKVGAENMYYSPSILPVNIFLSPQQLLKVNNITKIRLKTCSAYQSSINIRLFKKLLCIRSIHRATI